MEQKEDSKTEAEKFERLAAELVDAALHGDTLRVGRLLASGAAPDARGIYGETPLHWAAWLASAEIARLALAAGADPSSKKKDGETPLHWAAASGSAELAEILIAAGADLAAKNDAGLLPEDEADGEFKEALASQRRALSKALPILAEASQGRTPEDFRSGRRTALPFRSRLECLKGHPRETP